MGLQVLIVVAGDILMVPPLRVAHIRMSENTRLRFQAVAHRLEEKEYSPMSDSLVFQKLLEMGL